MLLKLELPHVNRMVSGGVIGKWHKQEGDLVGYGDRLVDIRGVLAEPPEFQMTRPNTSTHAYYPVGIVSSDRGLLRRIVAAEGATLAVGDLLALLDTDVRAENAIDPAAEGQAGRFRVTVNLVEDSE